MAESIESIRAHLNIGIQHSEQDYAHLTNAYAQAGQAGQHADNAMSAVETAHDAQARLVQTLEPASGRAGEALEALQSAVDHIGTIALNINTVRALATQTHNATGTAADHARKFEEAASTVRDQSTLAEEQAAEATEQYRLATGEESPTPTAQAHQTHLKQFVDNQAAAFAVEGAELTGELQSLTSDTETSRDAHGAFAEKADDLAARLAAIRDEVRELAAAMNARVLEEQAVEGKLNFPTRNHRRLPLTIVSIEARTSLLSLQARETINEATQRRDRL